jgi:hypothetical protein
MTASGSLGAGGGAEAGGGSCVGGEEVGEAGGWAGDGCVGFPAAGFFPSGGAVFGEAPPGDVAGVSPETSPASPPPDGVPTVAGGEAGAPERTWAGRPPPRRRTTSPEPDDAPGGRATTAAWPMSCRGAAGIELPSSSGQPWSRASATIARPTAAVAPSKAKEIARARSSMPAPNSLATRPGCDGRCARLWSTATSIGASERSASAGARKPQNRFDDSSSPIERRQPDRSHLPVSTR